MDRLRHARHGFSPGHGNPSQHVALKIHRAAPAAGPGEHLLERTERPRAPVAGDEPHAGEPAPPEPGEEHAPEVGRLGVSLGAADDLPAADGVDADGDRHGRVLVGSSPAALEADAVDENEGVVAIERHLPSGPDGCEGPLVEVGDGAGGHRPPQRSSETSSILLVETPTRYNSTMASSTEVSRLR